MVLKKQALMEHCMGNIVWVGGGRWGGGGGVCEVFLKT